jgi:hypothetical protein
MRIIPRRTRHLPRAHARSKVAPLSEPTANPVLNVLTDIWVWFNNSCLTIMLVLCLISVMFNHYKTNTMHKRQLDRTQQTVNQKNEVINQYQQLYGPLPVNNK